MTNSAIWATILLATSYGITENAVGFRISVSLVASVCRQRMDYIRSGTIQNPWKQKPSGDTQCGWYTSPSCVSGPKCESIEYSDCANTTDSRVINGKQADAGQFPWIAQIQVPTGGNLWAPICGGSIIHDRYILTAAHCFKANDPLSSRAVTQKHALVPEEGDEDHTYTVVKYWSHTSYNPSIEGSVGDAMVLRTDRSMELNLRAKIIPVTLIKPKFLGSATCYAAGWGLSRQNPNQRPKYLQYADVHLEGNRWCKDHRPSLDETVICSKGGEPAACEGDSGGPLTCFDCDKTADEVYLVGVVSFNLKPCASGKGVFYGNVYNLRKWITGITKDGKAHQNREASFGKLSSNVTTKDATDGLLLPRNSRIYMGKDTAPGQFPWILDVRCALHRDRYTSVGVATIISKKYAITNANIFLDFDPKGCHISAGAFNPDTRHDYSIEAAIKHPKFSKANPAHNNIMLLRVRLPIKAMKHIKSIRMTEVDDEDLRKAKCYVAGWGDTGKGFLNNLKYTEVRPAAREWCKERYLEFDDSKICAKQLSAGPCKGDLGAPLTCSFGSTKCGWDDDQFLVGFATDPRDHCSTTEANYYLTTTHYLSWIREVTGLTEDGGHEL